MKKYYIRFLLVIKMVIIFHFSSQGQLLNMPESAIYDTLFSRYLVTNYGTGSIIQIDENGNQSYFVSNKNATQGIEIVDSIAYVGCDSTVRGFHLRTGVQVMNLKVEDVVNLNDVTSDSNGNLYVTDVFGRKIIKVYPQQKKYTVFVNGNGISRPNGIVYDKQNNRLLVCSYREDFPIQAISLEDSTVTTLVETTLDYSDGIIIDKEGYVYVTSWETEAIYKYNPEFTSGPDKIYRNPGGPADISFNKKKNEIVIPLQQSNKVAFLSLGNTTSISDLYDDSQSLLTISPIPANNSVNITTSLNEYEFRCFTLQLVDILGNVVKEVNYEGNLMNETLELGNLNSGVYIINLIQENKNIISKKIILQ